MFALFLVYVALLYIHPGELVPALAPYRIAYWVGTAGLAVAVGSLALKKDGRLGTLQLWTLLAFAAVTALSLTAAERWLGAPLLTLQRFGPSMTMFVLAIAGVTSLPRLRVAAVAVVMLTLAVMLQGAAAYHLGYNSRSFLLERTTKTEEPAAIEDDAEAEATAADEPVVEADAGVEGDDAGDEDTWAEPRIRGLGTLHDPNDLALAMVVALGLVAGAWNKRSEFRTLVLTASAAALVYGIYLTRSRGGVVALLVVLWRFASKRAGWAPALVLSLVLAGGVVAFDVGGRPLSIQPDESASGRLVAWTEGIEMLKSAPLLGVGYGQFSDHHTLTAHNSLVLCFAETGLLGCFLWVGLLVTTLLELQRLKKLPGAEAFDAGARRWAEGLQLALIGFLVAAFFLSRTFAPTLYLILGLSAALAATARAAGRSVPLPPFPELGTLALISELAAVAVVYTVVKLHFA